MMCGVSQLYGLLFLAGLGKRASRGGQGSRNWSLAWPGQGSCAALQVTRVGRALLHSSSF